MPFLNNLTILLCMCDLTCCTDFKALRICRRAFVATHLSMRICRRDFVCALLSARSCRRAIILRVYVYEPTNILCRVSVTVATRDSTFTKLLLFLPTSSATRWAGQSPKWGRPVPKVRVASQFRQSKLQLLSQQWQLANVSKRNRVAHGLASAYSQLVTITTTIHRTY